MQVVLRGKPVSTLRLFLFSLLLGLTYASEIAHAQEVLVPDPGLNAAFRRALGKLTGPLTAPELLSLTNLNADTAFVQNLEGLSAARNLVRLDLQNNFITNATFPPELTGLRWLDLHASHLTEFTLPPGITNLNTLNLGANYLTRFSVPAGLGSLTNLELGFNQLTNLVLPKGLTNLVMLSLPNNRLTELVLPSDSARLTHLFAFANQLTNLILPAGLGQLAYLDVHINQLSSLDVPEGLTNLARIDAWANRLMDLDLPAGLTSLNSLALCCNQLTEFIAPPDLTALTVLSLGDNPLRRVALPAALRTLIHVDLPGDQLTEVTLPDDLTATEVDWIFDQSSAVTVPAGMVGLAKLSLTGSRLADLTALADLPGLSQLVLNLPGNPTPGLTLAAGLTNLTFLHIGENQLVDFSFLDALPGLHALSLKLNESANLTWLIGLTNLNELQLQADELNDASFLANLPRLRTLELQLGATASLALPEGLTNLTSLTVFGHLREAILPGDLRSLASLSLAGNQLASVTLPDGLANLSALDLSRNQLATFTLPAGLTNLVALDLSLNLLTNLSSAAELPKLTTLNLRRNQLASLTLPSTAPQLAQLFLDDNPVQVVAVPEQLAGAGLADELAKLDQQGVLILTYQATLFDPPAVPVEECPEPSFALARSAPAGPNPRSMAPADFNGDGLPDLAVAHARCPGCFGPPREGWVSIWLGHGDGSYHRAVPLLGTAENRAPTPGQEVPGAGPASVSAGDLDGDGKPDLAIANEGTYAFDSSGVGTLTNSHVSILKGNGDGTFQSLAEYSVGSGSIGTVIADFNRDGIPDLAVANRGSSQSDYSDGSVSVLMGQGDGTFQPGGQVDLRFGVGLAAPPAGRILVAGDLNQDGAIDLATLRHDDRALTVLINQGDGTFLRLPDLLLAGPVPPTAVAVGDLNGDGKLDLAVANSDTSGVVGESNSVIVLLGNGDGTFRPAAEYPTAPWPGTLGSVDVALGDLNGDGRPDLVVANGDAACVSVLLGRGGGGFLPARNYEVGPGVFSLSVTDVNRDGNLDLLLGSASRLAVLLGTGDGTFPAAVKFAPGRSPVAVAAGDFDLDGALDLVVANSWAAPSATGQPTASPISILRGNGNGTFQPAVDLQAGRGPGSVAVGDLNKDGRPDLVVVNHLRDFRSGQTNNGSLVAFTFAVDGTLRAVVPAGSGVQWPVSVKLGDLDRDGWADVTLANNGVWDDALQRFVHSSVSIFRGRGDGTLELAADYPVEFGPNVTVDSAEVLTLADFNRDGQLDLVVSGFRPSPSASGVYLFLNRGNGVLAPPAWIEVEGFSSTTSVVSGDFNGDGTSDLALAGDRGVFVLLGTGDGRFQPPARYELGVSQGTLAVGDFDGDLHPDLALIGGEAGLSLLFGDGRGGFERIRHYGVGAGPCCLNLAALAVGDFNGDGQPDLAVADGVNVAVHINRCVDFRPALFGQPLGNGLKLSWSWPSAEFRLESATTLRPGNWQPALEPPSTNNHRLEITVPATLPQRFYRLIKPSTGAGIADRPF